MSSKGTPLFPGLLPCSWSCVEAHEGSRGILGGTGWCQAAKAQLTGALPPLLSMGTSPIASLKICPGRLPWQSYGCRSWQQGESKYSQDPNKHNEECPTPTGDMSPWHHSPWCNSDGPFVTCMHAHTHTIVCLTHPFQMCAT